MFMVAKLMFFCKITTISPRCQPLKTISPGGYHIDFQFYQKYSHITPYSLSALSPKSARGAKENPNRGWSRLGYGVML
jgi:hypothetical protein